MVEFVESGMYDFDPDMLVEYPYVTLLDLHVHAYCVGAKYDVPRLCEYAVEEYIGIAAAILGMRDNPDYPPLHTGTVNHLNPTYQVYTPPSPTPNDLPTSPAAMLDHFLNSLVLLWRKTPHRADPLRAAVLELLKPHLNALMQCKFFITMMLEMPGFGDDILHSLADDGFDVTAFPVPVGWERWSGVRFGGV